MPRRALLAVLLVAVAVPTTGAQGPYELPEPTVTARDVFRAPAAARACTKRRTVTVRILTPPGIAFAGAEVRLGPALVRLGRVLEPARMTLPLPSGRSTLRIEARTAKGQEPALRRTYRRCAPARKRTRRTRSSRPGADTPPGPVFEGGASEG